MQALGTLRAAQARGHLLRALCARADAAAGGAGGAGGGSAPSRWQLLKAARRAAPAPKRRQPKSGEAAPAAPAGRAGLGEAVDYVQRSSWAGFDETVELAVVLGIDPRVASQNVRTHALLPHGHGVRRRVAVLDGGEFARGDGTFVAGEELLDAVVASKGRALKGVAVAIAPAPLAAQVAAQAGRFLGPKGLLPNTREGTVVKDVAAAAEKAATQWVRIKADRAANVHVPVGKVSMDRRLLEENVLEVVKRIMAARPAAIKRGYLKRASVCSTMGKGVSLDVEKLARAARLFESRFETM